jgi:hypothetical protein
MKNHTVLLSALLSLFALPAFADQTAAEPAPQGSTMVKVREVHQGGMRAGAKVDKNQPYSAEVISERQQNLADGNQIVSKNVSYSFRDSAGRTRQEMRDDKGELRTVTIRDPLAGATWLLDPKNKTATQIAAPHLMGASVAAAARLRIEQLRKEGKLPQVRNEIILRRSDNDDDNVRVVADGDAPVRIEANSATGNAGNPRELLLGPLAGAFSDMKWSHKAVTRELGVREIDGVRAEGKMRSYEIPAGEVGNRNPIVVSDESWYSPDLQITLMTRHSDPRSGEHSYRLAALKREEPAASLFAVPGDYTVKDALANVRMLMEKKAEAAGH